MKIAIKIFTIYMLSLVLLPCSDNGGGVVETIQHFFNIEHQHGSSHTEHSKTCGDDHCSPFCTCTCCSTVISSPENSYFFVNAPTPIPEIRPSYISKLYFSSFHSPVWQPPTA